MKEAIKGMKLLNMNSVEVMAVKEITTIFAPDLSREINLEIGQFVRVKRGLYDGDLAIVEDFDDSLKRIKIRLIPRLLSGNMSMDEMEKENGDFKIKTYGEKIRELSKKNMRPVPKFFMLDEYMHDAKPVDTLNRGT